MSKANLHRETWRLLLLGDPKCLDILFKEHYVGLSNYGMKLTGRRELVRDAITQVIIDLWNIRHRLPEVQNVRSYLMTTLRRKLMKEIKAEQKIRLQEDAVLNSNENAQMSYEDYLINVQKDALLRKQIHSALEKLTQRQRELLKLRFFEDKTYDEIADQCGITKRTAYNIVYDALTQLRSHLTDGRSEGSYYSFSNQFVVLALLAFPF